MRPDWLVFKAMGIAPKAPAELDGLPQEGIEGAPTGTPAANR